MQATRILRQHRQPMIRFLGKRSVPKSQYHPLHLPPQPHPLTSLTPDVDHTPHVHPAAPADSLPESFAQYRNRAIQHGPLGGQQQQTQQRSGAPSPSSGSSGATPGINQPYGSIGGRSAQQLGSVQPGKGEVWDREELPVRFRRRAWTAEEMEAVESGGASMFA